VDRTYSLVFGVLLLILAFRLRSLVRLTSGHVGCCDSSPGRHATRHCHQKGHPVVASFEPGERWAWCNIDQAELDVPEEFQPYLL
jgi:hypothetical protein